MEDLNQVRRLHKILNDAVEKGDLNKTVIFALQQAEEINNIGDQTQQLLEFYQLLRGVELAVKNLKVKNPSSYIQPMQDIQKMFVGVDLIHKYWKEFQPSLVSRHLLNSLSMCADAVEIRQDTFVLRKDELEAFLKKFEFMQQEVNSSDLDEDAKTFLKLRLQEICNAIREYSLGNVEEIRNAARIVIADTVIGSIHISNKEKEKKIFKDILNWLVIFGSLVTGARNTTEWLLPEITENAPKLIESISKLTEQMHKLLPPSN